jgi:hypothetical protein
LPRKRRGNSDGGVDGYNNNKKLIKKTTKKQKRFLVTI